jgi:DNA polymerase-3 subunit alpha
MAQPFVHLHVHTEYSLLDGASRIPDLVDEAKAQGMPALAISDHGNLFGAIEFYKECRAKGIKPIIGCEAYLAPGSRLEKKGASSREAATHLLLLAKDAEGYKNLIQLISSAHLEGHYYKPRIDKEILARHSKGLIGTSACLKGEVAQAILQNYPKEAEKSIDDFRNIFAPGDFYLEVADHGLDAQRQVARELRKYGRQFGLKLVATNDVHYVKKEHAAAHDVLLCIQTGARIMDEKRLRYPAPEFYFKSAAQMEQLFAEIPEALKSTLEIAERCNVEIELGKNKFPVYKVPEGMTHEAYLRQLCEKGLAERYGARAQDADLKERLDYELNVIGKTGFLSYFLIVWDFIDYAKRQGIPVGPGRGSAAGSMISYVLGITDLDPLRYGLFFERFLNPERVSPPDIDVDFCYNRRSEVIDYVRKKYGERSVAQIITFGTLGAKMAVRDVGRVLGLSYGEADRLAKMIPFDPKMTLKKALEQNPEFKRAYDEEEISRQVIDYALTLEGLSRQAGVHAAGVVIADGDLTEMVPLTTDDSGGVVTQYSMEPLGDVGALKMDFLGLKTLTVINDTLRLIEETTGQKLKAQDIPLDDAKTYALLSRAQNVGVFQVESAGMCDLCRRLKPSNIEDIIALVALFRPGPMENIPAYADRKLGKVKIQYDHPLLEPILKDTYGVMIYQEQVMQAANALAGYTLGQADLLRRAMGKKKPEEMAKQREMFVKGCMEKNKIPEKQANEIFETLEKFAGYGFNKAHSACYGLLAYQTAYLKANYPVAFMAALLSNELDNTDKIAQFVAEARAMGIEIRPPNLNESGASFSVRDGAILFGMAGIKNVGEAVVRQLVAEREKNGLYASLSDVCARNDARALNRKMLESLIKAGAADCFGANRRLLMQEIEPALAQASALSRDREAGQGSLLDIMSVGQETAARKKSVAALPDWSASERLAYEKELLGFYVTGHPLEEFAQELPALALVTTAQVAELDPDADTRVAGLLTKMEVRMTQKDKKPWARMTVEDLTGAIEVLVFPDTYAELARTFTIGEVVVVSGQVDRREETPKIRASAVHGLEEGREQFYRGVIVDVSLADWSSQRWLDLQQIVFDHPGKAQLHMRCVAADGTTIQLEAAPAYGVGVNQDFCRRLKEFLGQARFEVVASKHVPKSKPRKWQARRN